jgi:hypothetical protein
MYADPQSVTINAVPVSLPRTGSSLTEGSYLSSDAATGLNITHRRTNRGRVQHRVGLRKDVIVPSIYNPAQNAPQSYSVAIVIDAPTVGIASVDIAFVARALVAWATNANVDKLVAAEI